MTRMLKAAAWLTAMLLILTLTSLACGTAKDAPMHRVYRLRYVPHTILCHRWQIGARGLVYGDGKPDSIPVGKPFTVVCEWDGQIPAWDAESW